MCDRLRRPVALVVSLAFIAAIMVPQRGEASQTQDRSARVEHAVGGEVWKIDQAAKTADKAAVAVDHIGRRPLSTAKGTVTKVDEAGKFVVIKTTDGIEETYQLTRGVVRRGDRPLRG